MFTKTIIKYSDIAKLIEVAKGFKLSHAEKRELNTVKYLEEVQTTLDTSEPNSLIQIELDTEQDIKYFVRAIKDKSFGCRLNNAEKRDCEIWKLEDVIMELAEKHKVA